MGYLWYVKAKNYAGDEVIIKIREHHGDIESIEEIDEEQMNEEIKEYFRGMKHES